LACINENREIIGPYWIIRPGLWIIGLDHPRLTPDYGLLAAHILVIHGLLIIGCAHPW